MPKRLLTALMLLVFALPVPALAAGAAPRVIGLVLIGDLPKDAALVGLDEGADGYTERLLTSDGLAAITLTRRAGGATLKALLSELYPDAAGIEEAEQPPIASYPARRVNFTLGENEDARAGALVAFSTDTDTFAFAADAQLDAYEGDEDYKGMFDSWIGSLDLFDGAAGAGPDAPA